MDCFLDSFPSLKKPRFNGAFLFHLTAINNHQVRRFKAEIGMERSGTKSGPAAQDRFNSTVKSNATHEIQK
jgi:hypothetical protein